MNRAQALPLQYEPSSGEWHRLCHRQELVANSGVVAWFAGAQIALFFIPNGQQDKCLYAIHNHDPQSGANVIGRGIVGQLDGALVVASPLYKQHFRLEDGQCLEKAEQRLQVWPVRLNGDRVEIWRLEHPGSQSTGGQALHCSLG